MSKILGNKQPRLILLRQALSLLATFYLSYLFLHFVILELTPIENTLVIVAIIWAGHLLLNLVAIAIRKKQTFGDLLFRLQYQSLKEKSSSRIALRLLSRSFLTTNLLYLLICLNVQLKFSMGVLFASMCIGVLLLIFPVKRLDFQSINLFDWISGVRAT